MTIKFLPLLNACRYPDPVIMSKDSTIQDVATHLRNQGLIRADQKLLFMVEGQLIKSNITLRELKPLLKLDFLRFWISNRGIPEEF